jgi:hypothetical protein
MNRSVSQSVINKPQETLEPAVPEPISDDLELFSEQEEEQNRRLVEPDELDSLEKNQGQEKNYPPSSELTSTTPVLHSELHASFHLKDEATLGLTHEELVQTVEETSSIRSNPNLEESVEEMELRQNAIPRSTSAKTSLLSKILSNEHLIDELVNTIARSIQNAINQLEKKLKKRYPASLLKLLYQIEKRKLKRLKLQKRKAKKYRYEMRLKTMEEILEDDYEDNPFESDDTVITNSTVQDVDHSNEQSKFDANEEESTILKQTLDTERKQSVKTEKSAPSMAHSLLSSHHYSGTVVRSNKRLFKLRKIVKQQTTIVKKTVDDGKHKNKNEKK